MHRAIGEVTLALARARRTQAVVAARGPAMHHRVGDVGMELETERVAHPDSFDREIASLRQQLRTIRQLKTFAVPMIDMIGPAGAGRKARRGRPDRIIS